jgi:hypothetical protein
MPPKGYKHTKASRLKMRSSKIGKRNNRYGTKHTDATKQKMSLARSEWCAENTESLRGANSGSWKGGASIDSHGYRIVKCYGHPYNNNDYVKEHRLVVEKRLHRFLVPSEVVHHIDGNKLNNKASNLICFINNGVHKRFHGRHSVGIGTKEIIFDGRINASIRH